MQLSNNQKKFSQVFSKLSEYIKNLEYFQKKFERQRWFPSEMNDWEKRSSLNAQKAPVSEHLWKFNILKGPKHCFNPHGIIFVIFFVHSERKSAPKTIFKKYLKSFDCLLRYWQPIASILSH